MSDTRPDATVDLGLSDQPDDLMLPSRWSLSGLDVFWPILAVVLVGAVIFVASVAHSSMDSVGVPVSQATVQTPKPPTSTTGPLLIVQISSHATRSAALAASQELIERGIDSKVLKSDRYSPLNRGYYVVFTGPYARNTTGRAEAKRVQDKIPGALLRDNIRPRVSASATPTTKS